VAAARYYELSVDHSPVGAARFGRHCHIGRPFSVDHTIAAGFFRKAADSNSADVANSFGCCPERGEGVAVDIDLGVRHCQNAASQSQPAGLYGSGCCLEVGRVI
jgi:TPR repeat protein